MGYANIRAPIGKAQIEFWAKRNAFIPSPALPYNEWEIPVFKTMKAVFKTMKEQ